MQYSNSQDIIKSTANINAERIDQVDRDLLLQENFEVSSLRPDARDNFEVHVYTPDGTYLTGNHALVFNPSSNIADNKRPSYNVQIDLKNELNKLNIKRGQYKVIVNFFDTLLGNINEKNVWVKEISQSKTEVKVSIPKSFLPRLYLLLQIRYSFHKQGLAAPILLNFGNNRIYPVVNFKIEPKYDLSDIIRDSVPQSYINQYPNLSEDKILEKYAYEGAEGNLLRESNFQGYLGQYYVIQNGLKRSFDFNDTLLFEFAKYFESSRFDRLGKEIRKAHPYIELGGNGLPQPRLLDLTKGDLDGIPSGPTITLTDLIGDSDYYNIVFKLYKPLEADITEKTSLYISNEYREPYTDTVYLIDKSDPIQYNQLRPANFNVDAYSKQSIPTEYKNWNELLDANLTTSQKLIDSYFSGSLQGIPLNINFGEFENFVHFSSAVERVKNFKYKLELIEYYSDRITSLSGSLSTNLTPLYAKRNTVVSTFDNFEKYLFYDSGSLQLYTHVSYSIDPWPKLSSTNNSNDPYSQFGLLYRVSQSVADDYYNDLLEQATIYDHNNVHRLLKAVPLHIRMADGNEDFNVFVDMLGHHYDIIWTYINHMSKIYSREEHPQDGMSNDLIYHAAKSLGFQLYNGRSTSELWKYLYGTDNSGSLSQEGVNGVYSLPDRQVTQEYWRRLLNNLPYLLKTKGTERSIKALLSCFGIPSTLLTIKEFGGPSTFVEEATHYPEYVHDKFTFAYKTNTGSGSADPKNNYLQVIPSKTTTKFSKNVNAIEFRFKTDTEETYTPGIEYNIFSYHNTINYDSTNTSNNPLAAITIKKDSATDTEGTLTLRMSGATAVSMSNVNIFDNEFNLLYLQSGSSGTTLQYRKAKYGKIVESGSTAAITAADMFGDINTPTAMGAIRWGNPTGVTLGVSLYPFVGHIQEIRLWSGSLNTASLNEHTLSPNTYTYNVNRGALTGNEALEPYNRLVQRYPLSSKYVFETSSFGVNTASIQYSAHPNQNVDAYKFTSTGTNLGGGIWLVGASGSILNEVFDTFEETYYTPSPSLGGNSLYTNKVRIEENSLTGFLSPYKRVEASSFDKYSIDSNKVGIYFSPQDSINEDIFNQLGYYEIDDYIGDPGNIYNEHYPEFEDFASDYWKKYNNKNDFEAFFRALSIYDSTIFRYIKDMLPFRANVVSGFLIEPNALERKRFRTTKPTIENLSHEAEIQAPIQTQEGFYLTYEGAIEEPAPDINSDYPVQTDAIIDINDVLTPGGEIKDLNSTITAVISNDLDLLGSSWNENRYVGQYKVGGLAFDKNGNVRTGSLQTNTYTPIQTVVNTQRYELTGSSYALNTLSGSIANLYAYLDDSIYIVQIDPGGGQTP
jgi:hypothetical protein